MEFDMTPYYNRIVIQGCPSDVSPLITTCQEKGLTHYVENLTAITELTIVLNDKKSSKQWRRLQETLTLPYLSLDYVASSMNQRWQHYHPTLLETSKNEAATQKEMSPQQNVKEAFNENIQSLNVTPSFYQSKLYFSMLHYIMLESITRRPRFMSQKPKSIKETYINFLKTWSAKKLTKYQHYSLNTLEDLGII